MMTDRIAELRKMVADATPGPWEAVPHEDPVVAEHFCYVCVGGSLFELDDLPDSVVATSVGGKKHVESNARLVAQAPTLATDLANALEEIARLREAGNMLNDALAWIQEHRGFCDIPSLDGEWDERSNAALNAWDALEPRP